MLALSLSPLFLVAFILSILHVAVAQNASAASYEVQPLTHVFHMFTIVASALVLVAALLGSFYMSQKRKRRGGPGFYKVLEVVDGNEQALTFFTAIVVPVISLAVSSDIAAYICFWLIVFMLVPLLVKTGTCYWNPVLVMFGCCLYEAAFAEIDGEVRIISWNGIKVGDKYELVQLSGRCFYAR